MPHDVEHLRPEYGFVILTDGQILRGSNQSSWDEDNIAQWYAWWMCKKRAEAESTQPEVAFRPEPKPLSTSASSSTAVFEQPEAEAKEEKKIVKETKARKQKKSKK